MIELDDGIKPKTRRARGSVPANIQKAFKAYADAYQAIYIRRPRCFEYDRQSKFIRIDGEPGVSLKRLQEMTRNLRARFQQ